MSRKSSYNTKSIQFVEFVGGILGENPNNLYTVLGECK